MNGQLKVNLDFDHTIYSQYMLLQDVNGQLKLNLDFEETIYTQYMLLHTGYVTNGSQGATEVKIKICVCVSGRKSCTNTN